VPFRFNGRINSVTFKLGPPQLTAADAKVVGAAVAKSRD
jgi:arylsulfatase